MASSRFTDLGIRNLKPGPTRREIPDPGARGLYVVVQPSGVKGFALRYRFAGVPRKLTLQAGISLAAARKLAADAMHEVAQGRDPSAAKKAEKAKAAARMAEAKVAEQKAAAAAANTVQAICTEYLAREARKLRTGDARESTLRRLVFPIIGDVQVDQLKRSEISRMLDRVEDQAGPRSADLALSYLRRVFIWHASRTDDFRSPLVPGMGRWNAAERARSRVLDDGELRAIWVAAAGDAPFNALVRFLLLTGARRGEAARLTWDEIDGATWHLPASRNKAKEDLARPLSRLGQAVLAERPRIDDGPLVFSHDGRRPLSFGAPKRRLDAASGVRGWRLHDLRRTARTLLSRAGVAPDVAERCLGHRVGSAVQRIYDRHQYQREMQTALEALAALIERIVNPPEGQVVPLRKR